MRATGAAHRSRTRTNSKVIKQEKQGEGISQTDVRICPLSHQDYLRGEDEGWPICHVKTVLKRIPLEELKALVDEPCNASCIDVDNTRRLKDEEVRELIAQQSGAATEDAFQELEREQQENIIVWLRDEGASVRQIVSHTGFTTKQVRNLTDKDKKKQAD